MSDKMRLQGIGVVKGTQASEIKIGDTLMWNYGGTSTVETIKYSKTGKTIVITEKWYNASKKEFQTSERKMTTSRLVCILKDGKFTIYK